jgi:filamentous hemagglutinin
MSRFLVLLAALVAFPGAATASDAGTGEARGQAILTSRALRHIQERHWPDSQASGAGKFAPGITEDSLREMINEAVTNGRGRPNTNGRSGQIYEYDFGRTIGTRINGSPASRLRVVVNARGLVVTAFPF